MELTLKSTKQSLALWIQLTKPGIIIGNLLTAFGGFMLARPQKFWVMPLLFTLIGLAFVIGSGCTFNNIIDVDLDKRMSRTAKRPLPSGQLSNLAAAVFGVVLGILGLAILYYYLNTLTMMLALFGWLLYVGVYSVMKYLTSFATWMCSLAGAIPPVVGYCAATHKFDMIAILLFLIVACWQMPHFLAIGIYREEDYAKGNIPILPCITNPFVTKTHMACYLLGFLFSCLLLYFIAELSIVFLAVIGFVGLLWSFVAIQGFFTKEDRKWAKKMFIYSLVTITAFSLVLPFCHVTRAFS